MVDRETRQVSIPRGGTLLITRRWFRFNTVGLAGVAVQLSALWFLTHALGIDYRLATAFAVEVSMLHNFAWHEVWTWRGAPIDERWNRLIRFHVANGLISVGANTLLTWVFTRYGGLPLLMSNLAAIAATSLLNFAAAELWVFGRGPA